jgi:hypothetical protein
MRNRVTLYAMHRDLSLDEMLERWGLRVIGGTLKNPLRTSTGGEAVLDDDLFLVAYVEGTEGFERAGPVLRHRYSAGLGLDRFRVRLPGESLTRALLRFGWFDLREVPERKIPERVLDEFRTALAARMAADPYRPPSAVAVGA